MQQESKGEIVIYNAASGKTNLEVKLQDETVWLNLNQVAQLFGRDKSVVSRHIRNIYKEKELSEKSTVAFFATVQQEGSRRIERQIEFYNLDMILSVGYRVNSKMGTQFRIWATKVLKNHLIQCFTINQKRLIEQSQRFNDLQNAVALLGRVVENRQLASPEAAGLLKVITDYSTGADNS